MPKGMLRAKTDGRVRAKVPCTWAGKHNNQAQRPAAYGGTECFESGDTAEVRAGELVPAHFEGLDGLVLEPTAPDIRLLCRRKIRWKPPGQGERTFYDGQIVDVPEGTDYPRDHFRAVPA